jgi:hypothetical protein
LGPASFRFVPSGGQPVEDTAFSPLFKLLTTAIVGGCAVWLAQLFTSGVLGTGRTTGVVWFIAGLVLMAWTWWHILRSRTRISLEGLHQSWIWNKQLAYDDLAYGKLIRVRGLDWLIAPRLYVRTLMGKFDVFYGATPTLIAEFERLVRELQEFRKP